MVAHARLGYYFCLYALFFCMVPESYRSYIPHKVKISPHITS